MNAGLFAITVGGAASIALVGWFGAQAIGHEVLEAGWAIPATVALHAVQLFLSAVAWRMSVGVVRPSVRAFFRIRWIRESVNSLLPVAQLGGNIVGIRLLALRGVPGAVAGAGTTLDITIESLSQLVFTLAGILTLALIDRDRSWAPWVEGALATMAVGVAAFIAAQRVGLLRIVEILAERLGKFFPSLAMDAVRGLHSELMRLQQDHRALTRATLLHLLAWVLGVGETWLALTAMGVPTSLPQALVIESLGMAARSAGFAVPGALGVQETGFILVCGLFGILPDTAIALSMVKRARELLVGVPGLIAWQWTEGSRILRRRPTV